jgi:hypothetical protein
VGVGIERDARASVAEVAQIVDAQTAIPGAGETAVEGCAGESEPGDVSMEKRSADAACEHIRVRSSEP